MPEWDGIEFVRRMRQLPSDQHAPVVMVTVYDDRGVRYAALGIVEEAQSCMT